MRALSQSESKLAAQHMRKLDVVGACVGELDWYEGQPLSGVKTYVQRTGFGIANGTEFLPGRVMLKQTANVVWEPYGYGLDLKIPVVTASDVICATVLARDQPNKDFTEGRLPKGVMALTPVDNAIKARLEDKTPSGGWQTKSVTITQLPLSKHS